MKKIRYYLVTIALVLTLSGSVFLGVDAGTIASAASSQHVSASAMTGKSTRSVTFVPKPWCPGPIAC
ncbi:MAG TPA: hypothetical protein VNW73_07605 [Ktedonobacteraceae bacterium]|nr:hypothetical protein [Ktedonobacteraceae bacterium]